VSLLTQLNIPTLSKALGSGDTDPLDYLNELEITFTLREPDVLSFILEEDRFGRLENDIKLTQAVHTDPGGRPPLYCLPIGVKDIFHVNGFKTKAGSKLPPDRLKGTEAKTVTILKNAGALVFGKTVTTEFAYFGPGPTKNPHNPSHTPGGSSSGSAAAVAVGLVPFAFGTQTIGSIIRPASYCGIVGFKPTYGRISNEGVIPLAPSVDTIGYFTRDIASTLHMAGFLCKGWKPTFGIERKPTLGISSGPYLDKANPEMLAHFESVCARLSNAGYKVLNIPVMADFEDIYHHHNVIVAVEASRIHRTWFAEFKDLYHPKTIELIHRGQKANPDEYQSALIGRENLRRDLIEIKERREIDLWLSPPAVDAAPRGLESTGDPVMNLPWTHCGFPSLNIPAGFNKAGLPMGLQVSAAWGQDEALLDWALEMEKVFIS
jgi:Asp-tRNA(Asn)/Glu-tRNA(Gln) amidotransferase A subunit family amidase